MVDIKNIHKKYATGKYKDLWFEINWTHANIVLQVANQFVERLKQQSIEIDRSLLTKGVLLHDIGVYSCYDQELNPVQTAPQYIHHGHIGYKIISSEGLGEKVARFASTHTGTGLFAQDIQRLGIDAELKDYIPITLEEELLCFADKFHSKYPSFPTFEEQRELAVKHSAAGGVMMDRYLQKFGMPDMTELHKKYDSWNDRIDKLLDTIYNHR